MNHYNYVTGEPVYSPGFSSAYTDPNERYQQISQAQQQQVDASVQVSGRVYGFGGASGVVGAPYMQPNQMFINPTRPQQQAQYKDRVEHVPGFNPGGRDVLLPEDLEEIADELQMQMIAENEEAIAKRKARLQGSFVNNGYYGYGWNLDYPDNDVMMKYRRKANEIRQEAINRRNEFNKQLSKLVHNYMGDELTEEELKAIYDGYDRTITAIEARNTDTQNRLNRLVPYSNQEAYAKYFAQLNDFYDKISGDDMQSFLEAQGVVKTIDKLEEEMHNRRNMGLYYDSNSYKRLLRKSIMEREGIKLTDQQPVGPISPLNLPQFSTLAQSTRMLEDGTLSISAPSWISGGKSMELKNEMEAHFEENKRAFLESIYAQEN